MAISLAKHQVANRQLQLNFLIIPPLCVWHTHIMSLPQLLMCQTHVTVGGMESDFEDQSQWQLDLSSRPKGKGRDKDNMGNIISRWNDQFPRSPFRSFLSPTAWWWFGLISSLFKEKFMGSLDTNHSSAYFVEIQHHSGVYYASLGNLAAAANHKERNERQILVSA